MTARQEPSGFVCECGKFHKFGMYVAAHWDLELTHTCDECGRQHRIVCGTATLKQRINGSDHGNTT